MGSDACTRCGSSEPTHVHHGDAVLHSYFTVGRGESEIAAARRWKQRALEAEAAMQAACDWIDVDKAEPMVAVASMQKHLARVRAV